MKEISEAFGSERHLVGTVTMPAEAAAARIGFVIVNAGVIHRIGPHRWHVKLARHMAGLGFPSIRFDPAGLGDSRVPRDAASFKEQAVRDARAAMDHLADVAGVKQFIIGGICSGAETGFNTALADPRVVGLWMLDGFAFPTGRTRWMRYMLKANSMALREIVARGWRKLASRKKGPTSAVESNSPAVAGEKVGDTPPADRFAQSLQAITDSGVAVYFLYSGSIIHLFNYSTQLHDRFAGHRFLAAVRVDFRPDIDHTVTALACQREVTRLVAAWCAPFAQAAPLNGPASVRRLITGAA
jgi:pimeloyl-ACP methyl ester carboxylesterase